MPDDAHGNEERFVLVSAHVAKYVLQAPTTSINLSVVERDWLLAPGEFGLVPADRQELHAHQDDALVGAELAPPE